MGKEARAIVIGGVSARTQQCGPRRNGATEGNHAVFIAAGTMQKKQRGSAGLGCRFEPVNEAELGLLLHEVVNFLQLHYHKLDMPDAVIYDDAAYHQGAPAFLTKQLNPLNGGTHIGIYLAWVILHRLESFSLRQTAASPVEEVRSRQLTGRDFLFAHCAGRLTSDALNKDGKAFTDFYYEELYLRDFGDVLVTAATGTYGVADSWANYDRLAAVIDKRFRGPRI